MKLSRPDKLRPQVFLVFASASALLAVLLGAFGAHALQHRVPLEMLAAWQTGVQYQLFHSLAILLLVLLQQTGMCRGLAAATWLALGILLFSGSLYLLVLTGIRGFGMVTPAGGLCFLTGWLILLVGSSRRRQTD